MISKETVLDKIEVIAETGHVQVRTATYFVENGARVSGPNYHRAVLEPGDARKKGQPDVVQAVADAVWTPEVVSAFEAQKTKQQQAVVTKR